MMVIAQSISIMNRNFFISFLLIIAFAKAYSQRNSSDIIYRDSQIKVVDIFLESTLDLEIITTDEKLIRISESQGGEYKNAVLLNSKVVNDTLKITDPFNPSFHFPQDKLSAHKIIDGKATLYLPKNLKLQITSRNCFLKLTGSFQKVFINLISGSCLLDQVIGDLHVVSVHADVTLLQPTSFVDTHSKYGAILKLSKKVNLNYSLKIETIDAPITIKD